jgi:hypothetical protein
LVGSDDRIFRTVVALAKLTIIMRAPAILIGPINFRQWVGSSPICLDRQSNGSKLCEIGLLNV